MGSRISMTASALSVGIFRISPQEFDLCAPYQRGSVWTERQRINLIRSLLWGIPTGAVVLSQISTEDYHWRVVDGKQRLEAVMGFFSDEFAVPAHWFAPGYSGDLADDSGPSVYFSDLDRRTRLVFERGSIATATFNPRTEFVGQNESGDWVTRERSDAEIVAFEALVFGLINEGGTEQAPAGLAAAAELASP